MPLKGFCLILLLSSTVLSNNHEFQMNEMNLLPKNIKRNLEYNKSNTSYKNNITITNEIEIILKHFGRIAHNLKYFKNIWNINTGQENNVYREKREAPRITIEKCSITKEKLLNIKTEILHILGLKKTLKTENNCQINLASTSCAELMQLLECGITNLKNQFVKITSNANVSSNEILKWKNTYIKMDELYLKIEDDLQKYDQKYENIINVLTTDLHSLKKKIDNLEKKLKDANDSIRSSTIKFCASEIHSRNIRGCIEDLEILHTKIPNVNITDVAINIIKTSYNYIINEQEMSIIDNLIDFINLLHPNSIESVADSLYEKMKEKNHLSSTYVLTFNSTISRKSSYLKNSLHTASLNLLSKFGALIRNENVLRNQIYSYATSHSHIFYHYLKELIQYAFSSNMANWNNTMSFIDKLPSLKLQVLAYYSLYIEMVTHYNFNGQQIIILIYKIKTFETSYLFRQLQETEKNFISKVKKEIPSGIKALLWDSYIFVHSKYSRYKLVSLHKYFGVIYMSTILAMCPSNPQTSDRWAVTRGKNYFKLTNLNKNHYEAYFFKIAAEADGNSFYFLNSYNRRLYIKSTIGGWIAFWYSIPKNCYQVFYDENKNNDYEVLWDIS